MGYGYSYGYGYGSGVGYTYGYASPPPPSSPDPPSFSASSSSYSSPPPPNSPPPCPSLSKSPPSLPPSSPPPPLLDSPPPPTLQPPPVSPPPPDTLPPPPPPATVKPRVALYYSPPPPIQLPPPPSSAPPPSLPPVSTQPYSYISPPPPPLTIPSPPPSTPPPPPPVPVPVPVPVPAAEPTPVPASPPPPVPTAPPPLLPAPTPPPVEPPLSPPTSTPVAVAYTPPAPKHIPKSPPPPARTTTRPAATNPNNNASAQNIVISKEAAAAIVVVAGLVTLSFVGAAFWFVKQRRRPETEEPIRYPPPNFMPSPTLGSQLSDTSFQRSPAFPGTKYSSSSYGYPSYTPSEAGLGISKLWFTYEDLCIFTNGFSRQNLLGEGGFGCVYRGCLPDGRQVAVKQLRLGSGQGEREFKAEVDIISRVHHRHLVSLVGYCISDNERMLVYDFVPNNTLYYHLHGNSGTALSWRTRIKIAAGAARGISYLHEDCHPRIIHRDIKSSNILLDNNFEAQVSDFGLARLAMDANSHVTTRVMGTFGYLAPEYALSGKLTAKSDVYSFGVVLLELITGRKPVDSSRPLGDESLVEWAKPYLMKALENRDFGELPDSRLENNFDEAEMHRMIEAAAACVRHSAYMRPRMSQVVRALDSLLSDTNLTNGVPPGQSEIFDEPQTEEIRMFQMREFGDYSSEMSHASSSRRHRENL
ncbi:Proline-rich receptor-like protein kinase PERK8 [Rhynchospora pubera]|uniref:non-specific serine/threonine protein kinase n=1 Tax=Rhynchospora pubera TaxID=906938 RepID=A0AAV8HUV0_9POAL|nr:Proline-rich receptor-like protein kinase PERK8 [Rhynchospora pubera]